MPQAMNQNPITSARFGIHPWNNYGQWGMNWYFNGAMGTTMDARSMILNQNYNMNIPIEAQHRDHRQFQLMQNESSERQEASQKDPMWKDDETEAGIDLNLSLKIAVRPEKKQRKCEAEGVNSSLSLSLFSPSKSSKA
ncbi:hypothetical protein IHE45_07G117000 [Dioscorea alata]|uniref:Uncharacterized protein n=1 Tax=Dioscorea alata TaxID=55571 RepID=A0ACB7VUF5_DIOAL|nr:hypothetical protein IHE45_07G117000 [Dioscorea alata]